MHEGVGIVVRIREFVFKIGKDRVRVCSVDVTPLKDGEVRLEAVAWTDMLKGMEDLGIGAVLLQNRSMVC